MTEPKQVALPTHEQWGRALDDYALALGRLWCLDLFASNPRRAVRRDHSRRRRACPRRTAVGRERSRLARDASRDDQGRQPWALGTHA
jgi:hypothetical protein